eukprot:UN09078
MTTIEIFNKTRINIPLFYSFIDTRCKKYDPLDLTQQF